MNRVMSVAVSLLVLASAASATTQYIGVNITGENPDGDWGYSVIGPSVLASGDFVFGQDHWNNQPNSAGWQNHSQGEHRPPLLDSTGAPVGTMTISSDDRPLAGCRYNGNPVTQSTGSSGFAYPATLEQVLYNGLNYDMNNGVISVTLTNGIPAGGYTMNIFGSGGAITIHDATNNLDYATPGSLGDFATPGMQSVTLPATTGTTVYTFGAHGNWDNHLPPWDSHNSPLISAFQFVSAGAQTAPNFTADPAAGTLAFGDVGVSTSPSHTVTLNNIGTAAGNVTSAIVTGDFILSSGTAPVSV
ncbi:MAG: hypothetical protein NT031_08400, partial [Planctomycetota bacterium]|nr:hypothetical protein [Planctomycetota bacterium]